MTAAAAAAADALLQQHRAQVLSRYRELLRLIRRLSEPERAAAAAREARDTMRAQQHLTDPQARLDALKQLASRIGFLRITTPRPPGEGLSGGGGTFVLRDGRLVPGAGADKGSRCAVRLPVCAGACAEQEASRHRPSARSLCCLRDCFLPTAAPHPHPPTVDATGWPTARYRSTRPRRATGSTTSASTASPCPKRCFSERSV